MSYKFELRILNFDLQNAPTGKYTDVENREY